MRIVMIALASALVVSGCSKSGNDAEHRAQAAPAASPQSAPAAAPAPAENAAPAQTTPVETQPTAAPAEQPARAPEAAPSTAASSKAERPRPAPRTAAPASGSTSASHSQPAETSAAAEPAAPAAPAPPALPEPPKPVYKEVTIPQGTTLALRLETPVASDANQVEDPVRASLRRAISVDGDVIVPANTTFHGTVTAADRAGKVKGVARVALRFTRFSHDDEVVTIHTTTFARAAESSKKKDAAKIGIGAGAGALIGGIIGGGKGAAVGAGVGGGAGTGAVLATRGDEVRLPAGTDISVTTTEPITLQVLVQ